MNNNGIISFDITIGAFTSNFETFPIGDGKIIIAPFWGDVDTRRVGRVWYRETSQPELLARVRSEIQAEFVDQQSFKPKALFIVTWDHVGYFNSHTDRVRISVKHCLKFYQKKE